MQSDEIGKRPDCPRAEHGSASLATEPIPSLAQALTEIRRLRARVAELEAATAITLGTLEPPPADEPARYTHNVPPSAPPHDE